MTAFSSENIAKAISRVPATASKALKSQLVRATEKGIADLVTAVEAELSLRGVIAFDAKQAEQHALWSERAADLDLSDTIHMAFDTCPMSDAEFSLTQLIARNPGIGYQDLVEFRGKGDVGLILGHMVYERLGFFRKFVKGEGRMSDVLFDRDEATGRVSYALTPEARAAFMKLDLHRAGR